MANVADGHSSKVMIALLPTTTYWCKQPLPHMTLVFGGEISELMESDQNEMAKECLSLALAVYCIELPVIGVKVFGDEEKVDVLQLKADPDVLALYDQLRHWDKGEHPFNPHCTIGPEGSAGTNLPDTIKFDRIAVSWGDSLLPYKLL